MKISKQPLMTLVSRAKERSGENLALVGKHYQTVREVQWPAIRWYIAQLLMTTPCHAVNTSEMSVVFTNGSTIRCFAADRSEQMRDLHFTGKVTLAEITESEINSLIETGVIPPRYVPPPPGIRSTICPPAAHYDPDKV
jgi:hypothetical protein